MLQVCWGNTVAHTHSFLSLLSVRHNDDGVLQLRSKYGVPASQCEDGGAILEGGSCGEEATFGGVLRSH